jgi:flagellar motor switch protein FliN
MTEAAASAVRTQPASYTQVWTECLGQVLSQVSGSSVPCRLAEQAPDGLAPGSEGDAWIVGTCSGGLRGELSLRLSPDSMATVAQMFTGEAAVPETELNAEQLVQQETERREAGLELLRQVAGLVVTSLKPTWGEVQVRLEATAGAPSWPASSTSWLAFGNETAPSFIEVHLSAALVAALRTEKTESARESAAAPTKEAPPSENSQAKLGLLMEVELELTLRFGSRQLTLREILELSPGSVIELDRQVQEPVDMLLDGRLVARGEVVVINGDYGLRVTEVAPPPAL